MSEKLNFFSEEWCAAALLAVNSNDAVYQGFKDPGAFTNRMEFACTDREVVSHVEWDKGKVISWTPPKAAPGSRSIPESSTPRTKKPRRATA